MKKIVLILASLVFAGAAFAKSEGVALASETYLRQDKGNGGVEWAATVPCGTIFELENENPCNMTLISSNKKTENVEFYKVKYEGKSYYVQSRQIAATGNAGVITKNTVIFARPNISSFKNAELDFASVVSVGEKVNFAGIDFTEVQYFSEKAWAVVKVYVLSNDVSSNANDVKAVMVIDKANLTKDENIKKTLLKSALSLKTSAEIAAYVKDVNDELVGNKVPQSEISSELSSEYPYPDKVYSIKTGDGSKLNVRAEPKTGEVITQLDDGSKVLIERETDNSETIDGISNVWYQIITCDESGSVGEDSFTGWIFGGFVSEE